MYQNNPFIIVSIPECSNLNSPDTHAICRRSCDARRNAVSEHTYILSIYFSTDLFFVMTFQDQGPHSSLACIQKIFKVARFFKEIPTSVGSASQTMGQQKRTLNQGIKLPGCAMSRAPFLERIALILGF